MAASTAAAPISVSIPTTSDDGQGTVFYFIKFKFESGKPVILSKRFSQFTELHEQLSTEYPPNLVPTIPSKRIKLWVDHSDKGFIEQRRVLLETFLSKVVENENLANSRSLRTFMENDIVSAEAYGLDEDAKVADYVSEEVSEVYIAGVKQMSDHTLFQIYCANGEKGKRGEMNEWVSLKRYADFVDLDAELRDDFAANHVLLSMMPPLPPKAAKLMTDHTDTAFVEERKLLLENYLKKMIKIKEVINHQSMLRFLNADFN
eukprot:TRINITY_DN4155_c0_g1_i1.p1 TRINITY_DN4155_c0_g1~~TRINITY_DN4155_c0_g1_i1.p1  ORF type:complete len:261 (-),score=78.18 TRINITY_DN4155_c0_g1_i1:32-814(-)